MKLRLLLIVLILLLASCSPKPAPVSPPRVMDSPDHGQDRLLGGELFDLVVQKRGGLYSDAQLQSYVGQVGSSLADSARVESMVFAVVNDSAPTVQALPGGYVIVSRGLLSVLDDEAQLAAVLAHAISHLAERHAIDLFAPLEKGPFVSDGPAARSEFYLQTLARLQLEELADQLQQHEYTQGQQMAADHAAVAMLTRAGYPEDGVIELLKLSHDLLRQDIEKPECAARTPGALAALRERTAALGDSTEENNPQGQKSQHYLERIAALKETEAAYALYDQARSVEFAGHNAEAIEIYHRAMQQAPAQGLLHCALGMAYLRIDDVVPAKRYLLKAVAADPQFYRSRSGLGYLYLNSGEYQEASEQLQLAISLRVTPEGLFLLGQAEESLEHTERAIELYGLVTRFAPSSRLGHSAAERLKVLGR